MGYFDVPCGASGLAINGWARLIFVHVDNSGVHPILPSLLGVYDRFGRIDDPVPGAALTAVKRYVKKGPESCLEFLLDRLHEGPEKIGGKMTGYALVDEVFFRAAVATAAVTEEAALAALPFAELVAAAGVLPAYLSGLASDEGLRHDLLSLALFRRSGHSLTAAGDGGEQLTTMRDVEPYLKNARKKAGDRPLLVGAVEASRKSWEERFADDDDDDEDDARVAAFEPRIAELTKLLAFADDDLGEVDFEMHTEFDDDGPAAWTKNPAASAHFRIFGCDGTGSLVGFWIADAKKKLVEQPIIFMDSEGSPVGVAAADLAELLYLLGEGVGPREMVAYNAKLDREPIEAVATWVKSHYKRKFDRVPIIARRLKKRAPAFQAFVDQLIPLRKKPR